MQIHLLGSVEAAMDGEGLIELGHVKQRTVLASLAISPNQIVMLDEIIDRVWGTSPPATARSVAYTYISRLRRVLSAGSGREFGPAVVRRSGGYMLQIDPEQIDLHRFRLLMRRSREAARDAEEAVGLIRAALRLWRGRALTGLEGEWAESVRDLLEMEKVSAYVECHDLQLRLGQHAAIADELSALAAEYPLNEKIARNLMVALCRCGRPSEALRQYERLRRRLGDQFGVDPAPETQQLHMRMLRSDPSLIQLAAPRRRTVWTPPRQLPRGTAVVGRREELGRLDLMLEADCPLSPTACLISGPPGVGKTALAVHWAYRVASRFPDGQIFVDAHGSEPSEQALSPRGVLRHVLWGLGLHDWQIPEHVDECAELYRETVDDSRVLIVLDDATHPEQARYLIPPATGGALVITSPHADLLAELPELGEQLIRLPALAEDQSELMLAEILGRERVAAEPYALARIVQLCGGVPLALSSAAEHAVARPSLALADLAETLAC